MRILAIETSCDETAASVIDAQGSIASPSFSVIAQAVHSQIEAHRPYGGVYPNLAKREHAVNIIPILNQVISAEGSVVSLSQEQKEKIIELLNREGTLAQEIIVYVESMANPAVDAICVTSGPGLEPALWVGIRTAQALGIAWNIPVYPVNHMEGHVLSVLVDTATQNMQSIETATVKFPLLSLLISGGHTELVAGASFVDYEKIGETRDDAVGEAFDKVARILELSYPGGPEIGKLAQQFRDSGKQSDIKFPRPMINSGDLDFSFSGLKTAVLYYAKDRDVSDEEKQEIACAFENVVAEVLVAKTKAALLKTGAQTLIVAGGVAANTYIRQEFEKLIAAEFSSVQLLFPRKELATDNSVMIGIAGYLEIVKNGQAPIDIIADGNWSLGSKNA